MERFGTGWFGLESLGLASGQRRPCDWYDLLVEADAGWFNSKGQMIGWGDLATSDFVRISQGTRELFAVLKKEAHVYFVRMRIDTDNPAEAFLDQVAWIILPGRIFRVLNGKLEEDLHAFAFETIVPNQAKGLIFSYNTRIAGLL
jgi:hypothetical protein